MPSLTARLSAAAVAAVFVLFASAPAQTQDTGGGVARDATRSTAGDPMPAPTVDDVAPVGAGAAPPPSQLQAEPMAADITFVQPPTAPSQVTVPPQPGGPLTIGSFSSAVNNQAQNLARLNRLGAIPGERITVINVARLNAGPATTATARGMGTPTTGVDNAIQRAEARSAASARAAARNNTSIASALAAANISADNVLAIAVRGHNLNDVTIYHR